MKIGIVGSTGYVGQAFQSYCALHGIALVAIGREATSSADSLARTIERARIDFLVNCGGYTGKPNVDACESNRTDCLYGNAVLPGILRKGCEQVGLAWGHVSSGCIYNGKRFDGRGFTEEDPPNFCFRQNQCSFYSGSKALGEEILGLGTKELAPKCYIWRMRIPFENSNNPRNYLQKLLGYDRLLDAENSLSNLTEFVAACIDCFRLRVPFGIYNLTNPGSVTTRQVVEMILRSGISRKEFHFFKDEEEFMRVAAIAPRSNCVLDSSKAVNSGLKLTPIRDSLQETLLAWNP